MNLPGTLSVSTDDVVQNNMMIEGDGRRGCTAGCCGRISLCSCFKRFRNYNVGKRMKGIEMGEEPNQLPSLDSKF